ncbi:hypothetical protein D9M68_868990 [compost metagenome]
MHHHRRIELVIFHLGDQAVGLARDDVKVHRRVVALEFQRGTHQLAQRRNDGAELDGSSQGRICLGTVPGLLIERHELCGDRHQSTPLLVERHQFAAACEELSLEVLFQRAHLQPHRHLGECHTLTGCGEGAL